MNSVCRCLISWVAVAFVLGSCQSVRDSKDQKNTLEDLPVYVSSSNQESSPSLKDDFSMRGKVVAAYEKQKKTVRFEWLSTPQQRSLKIKDPFFGMQLGEWSQEIGQEQVLSIGRKRYTHHDIQTVAMKYLGAPVPFEHLHEWLQSREPFVARITEEEGEAFLDWHILPHSDGSIEILQKDKEIQLQFHPT